MTDNIDITPGTGKTVATDDCGAGGHVQIVKLAISTDGSATYIGANTTTGLDVHSAPNLAPVTNWIAVTIASLTTASTAYTNGDVMGGEMTFANAALVSGQGGYVESFVVVNNGTQLGAVDAFLFDSASTPAADNAANSWSDANMQKCVGVLPLYPAATSALNQVLQWEGSKRFKCAATSLFVVLVTRADHTFFGAATDLLCKMSVLRD